MQATVSWVMISTDTAAWWITATTRSNPLLRPVRTKTVLVIWCLSHWWNVKAADAVHLLEPPLAVLALVSDPSSITDAGSVDTFSRETILVTRFRRRGVSEQHKVKQNIDHQVSVDAPQIAVGGWSKKKEFGLTFPPRIHFFPPSRSTKPSRRPGPLGLLWEKASATQDVSTITKKSCIFVECYAYLKLRLLRKLWTKPLGKSNAS